MFTGKTRKMDGFHFNGGHHSTLPMRSAKFYHLDEYEKWVETQAQKFLPENRELVPDWSKHLMSEGLSLARGVKYITQVTTVEWLLQKFFVDVTEGDMRSLLAKIEHTYSEHYKHDLIKPGCVVALRAASKSARTLFPTASKISAMSILSASTKSGITSERADLHS